ncbi:TetR/AcrR family transcriptional regulator [Humitalea sp. 24SJ18S-53]|uniref:TetR/AcrR family transcriptional regulator n=1 Tax=Humitalea sp. 24SJ18S-53 TaxID=3422307 RepID=UPI003D66B1BF
MDHPPPARAPESLDARTRILDAAEAIVQARGVPALTLEAAARDAGVSKGGLLYHFASKQALLIGLMQRLAQFVSLEIQAGIEAEPPGPHRVARACLAWFLNDNPVCLTEERYDRASAVFLAAHHHDPALLDPIRAVFQAQKAALLADGTPPGPGLAIMAAGDGLFMAHIFGTWSITDSERAALRETLTGLLAS